MSDISFCWKWLDAGAMAPVEFGRTFASLSVLVDGQPVPRIEDLAAETVRDELHVPLYPLAEWIVYNWWCLLHEEPTPQTRGFDSRHSLACVADGFAYPPLRIAAEGTSIRLVWGPREAMDARLRFFGAGEALVDYDCVEDMLTGFIQSVCERLSVSGIEGTCLQREWDALRLLDVEERRWCAAVGAHGVDPFHPGDFDTGLLEQAFQELPKAVFEEMIESCSARTFTEDLDWLRSGLQALERNDPSSSCSSLPCCGHSRVNVVPQEGKDLLPHEIGYLHARALRKQFGFTDEQRVNPREMWADLYGDRQAAFRVAPKRAWRIDGIVGSGDAGQLAFYYGPRGERGERFLLARAIGEGLLDRALQPGARLVSSSRSANQKYNRAFAAELLAPAECLVRECGDYGASEEEVTELADAFNVSDLVVRHQLENRGISVRDTA
ncbi:MAG: ImmA/IrrE family metallo-endopeptidase [Opitutales bacterium]